MLSISLWNIRAAMVILFHYVSMKEDLSVEYLVKFHLSMTVTHPRWRLKCKFNAFFDSVLFVSGMLKYRDEHFVYETHLPYEGSLYIMKQKTYSRFHDIFLVSYITVSLYKYSNQFQCIMSNVYFLLCRYVRFAIHHRGTG